MWWIYIACTRYLSNNESLDWSSCNLIFNEELICEEFVLQCLNVVTFEKGGLGGQEELDSHEVVEKDWVVCVQ